MLHLLEPHIDHFVPHSEKNKRERIWSVLSVTRTPLHETSIVCSSEGRAFIRVRSIYISHFKGVLGHNTESLQFLTEQ